MRHGTESGPRDFGWRISDAESAVRTGDLNGPPLQTCVHQEIKQRLSSMGSIYQECRWSVSKLKGELGWRRLAMLFLCSEPEHDSLITGCYATFPNFLKVFSESEALPPWLSGLADFELWARRVRLALEGPKDLDPDKGPLRLASNMELRDYHYDFVEWLAQLEQDRPEVPSMKRTIVLFCRDRELRARYANAGQLDIWILKAVLQGKGWDLLARPPKGITREQFEHAFVALWQAGVILGDRTMFENNARAKKPEEITASAP